MYNTNSNAKYNGLVLDTYNSIIENLNLTGLYYILGIKPAI